MSVKYPGAAWLPTGGTEGQARDPFLDVVCGVILHVDGGNAGSLYNWFNQSGGVESNLFIGNESHPTVEQYRYLDQEADANYLGNSWTLPDGRRAGFISVETRGLGTGSWDNWQLAEIKKLLLWTSKQFNFPLRRCPGYRDPGIGYHVMFGAGRDTKSWSNASGKICPGPDRIKQFETVLTPWLVDAGKEWDSVATQKEIQDAVSAAVAATVRPLIEASAKETRDVLYRVLRARIDELFAAASAREELRTDGLRAEMVARIGPLVDQAQRTNDFLSSLPTSSIPTGEKR